MKKIERYALITGTVFFAIFLLADYFWVRSADKGYAGEALFSNVEKKRLEDLNYEPEEGELVYTSFWERDLTQEEFEEQKILTGQQALVMYNNQDIAQDMILPDGTFFLDSDKVYLKIGKENEEKDHDFWVAAFENPDVIAQYRSYREDAFYTFRKDFEELEESYRYYQLIVECFYLDGMTVCPEKISIYRVESQPELVFKNPITHCELMETIELDVPADKKKDCFTLTTEIDAGTVADLSYEYSRNGENGYIIYSDCTLTEKKITLAEREQRLLECMSEQYISQKRDFVGFSKFYYRKQKGESELLGGEVTMLHCENGIYYRMYQYVWTFVVMVVVLEALAAGAIAAGTGAVIRLISKRKK